MKQLETNKVNKRIWEISIFGKLKKYFNEEPKYQLNNA